MKYVKTIGLAAVLFSSFGFIGYTFAHGMGPHGGQLVDIAPYHLEFQVMPGMLHIYVIDKDKNALPLEGKATGKLILQMLDGTKKSMDLEVKGDNFMAIADVKTEVPFTAIATVQMDGHAYTARYENASTHEEHSK